MGDRVWRVAVFVALLMVYHPAQAADKFKVYLGNPAGERHPVGVLSLGQGADAGQFQFELEQSAFDNYFLSMRPFRCLEGVGKMLCYLPYPYQKPDRFTGSDRRALEYDFLFIQRQPRDYGIDPWNGLYYSIELVDGVMRGQARAVDLNLLAAPPEQGVVFPISADDLHAVDPAKLWLPTLIFERLAS